ncbi:MAG: glycosyltransferase family 2 protein [Nitrospiraceae bacterium]|nr:glycosyltransferase family 2 protein [Nitrospiraceae bacterium]
MGTKLSVIIISFNTRWILRRCLAMLDGTIRDGACEVIVVDNNSTDGSLEMMAAEFPEITVIRNEKNVGFAKANNQAIKIARGEYLLLLNSDAFATSDAIGSLVRFLDCHSSACIAGPKVLNSDGSLQSKGFFFPSVFYSIFTLVKMHRIVPHKFLSRILRHYYWSENETREVDWVSGCCLLVRKDAISQIGPLSEDFFMYCEDVELCFRAKKHGYQVWYVPEAVVTHLNCGSKCENRQELLQASRKILYGKSLGLNAGRLVKLNSVVALQIAHMKRKLPFVN